MEKHLDKIWAKVGIDVEFTRHFHDRVNDARNKKPINTAELIRIYREIYKKYGKPITKLKVVVLPAPFEPMNPNRSPLFTVRSRALSAVRLP